MGFDRGAWDVAVAKLVGERLYVDGRMLVAASIFGLATATFALQRRISPAAAYTRVQHCDRDPSTGARFR